MGRLPIYICCDASTSGWRTKTPSFLGWGF
jgi:hypothetical protein